MKAQGMVTLCDTDGVVVSFRPQDFRGVRRVDDRGEYAISLDGHGDVPVGEFDLCDITSAVKDAFLGRWAELDSHDLIESERRFNKVGKSS